MSDLTIATGGSAYPLFRPAGEQVASISALDPYFEALDQQPTPFPAGGAGTGIRPPGPPGRQAVTDLPPGPAAAGTGGGSGPSTVTTPLVLYSPAGRGQVSTGGTSATTHAIDAYG